MIGRVVRRVLQGTALLCVAVWTLSVGCLWVSETRLVFRAHVTRGISQALDPDLYTRVSVATTDGIRLEGAVLPNGPDADSRYWILFFPGAGNSILFRRVQSQLEQLHGLGYSVLAFDYRGFGRSAGEPSEAGLYQDALAAYGYLTDRMGVSPSRVVLAGRSLGSAVAVELATRVPSAGVILLSPIASVPDTAAALYPWAPVYLLASNRFDSLGKADRIRAPVLLVHSRTDRLVPIESARRLYSRIREPKLMLETGGGHNRAGFSPVEELAGALSRFWPMALESTASEIEGRRPPSPVPGVGARRRAAPALAVVD